MGNPAVSWCQEMDAVIHKHWPGKRCRLKIADEIGVCISLAQQRAAHLGYKRSPGRPRLADPHDYPKIPRTLLVAHKLAEGAHPRHDYRKLGYSSPESSNAAFQRIRKQLGAQAV